MAYYLDTSALTKLVVAEPESTALQQWLTAADGTLMSCDLARTELLRAVRRAAPDRMVRARESLDCLVLLQVTTETFEAAALLDPSSLRTLDALHIAAALTLGDELDGIVAYDERLADAATALGVSVIAPGRR
jgi:predicted nucleic acid-binding protein